MARLTPHTLYWSNIEEVLKHDESTAVKLANNEGICLAYFSLHYLGCCVNVLSAVRCWRSCSRLSTCWKTIATDVWHFQLINKTSANMALLYAPHRLCACTYVYTQCVYTRVQRRLKRVIQLRESKWANNTQRSPSSTILSVHSTVLLAHYH